MKLKNYNSCKLIKNSNYRLAVIDANTENKASVITTWVYRKHSFEHYLLGELCHYVFNFLMLPTLLTSLLI